MSNDTLHLFDDSRYYSNETTAAAEDNKNVVVDWLWTWSYSREHTERLVLYSVIAVCLGVIAVLLAVIFYLVFCRTRSGRPRRRILHSSSSNSDKKLSSRTVLSSTSTQTTRENVSLIASDSPDQTWLPSPSPTNRWAPPPDGPAPRLADPTSSPSTLRSLPLRAQSGPATVGDDPVWKTMDRQRARSPSAGMYTNPYRHDIFRTIDSRSSKSPRK